MDQITTADGRSLEVLTAGPEAGFPFLFHGGSPSAAVSYPPFVRAAEAADLRLVTYSRPGYGASTPRAASARAASIADDVSDVVAVLDELGLGEFVTLGWSGGGPRALACAALLPGRCRAAASLAGVAPYGVPGLDWTADMGQSNVDDFEAALKGREVLEPSIAAQVDQLAVVTTEDVMESLGDLVSPVDADALTGELAEYVAASFRRAAVQGPVGLLEDTLQIVGPWGFDVTTITVPVSIWAAKHDLMVPYGHGTWLAANIPGARAHLFDDEGHISLVNRIDEMLVELRELAGLPLAGHHS